MQVELCLRFCRSNYSTDLHSARAETRLSKCSYRSVIGAAAARDAAICTVVAFECWRPSCLLCRAGTGCSRVRKRWPFPAALGSSPSGCLCLRGVDALGAGGLVHRERIVAECPAVRLFAHFGSQPWPCRGGP